MKSALGVGNSDSTWRTKAKPLRKPLLFLACVTVLTIGAAGAQSVQPQPYKVVFDLTSQDPLDQQAVLRWIKEVSAVNPKTQMEVVMYGRGLDLVINTAVQIRRVFSRGWPNLLRKTHRIGNVKTTLPMLSDYPKLRMP